MKPKTLPEGKRQSRKSQILRDDVYQITSLTNPRVKEAVKLRQRSKRDESGQFLIEGYRELFRAVQGGIKIDTLFFCPELYLGENEDDLIEASNAQLLECTPQVFAKLSYRDRPDGLLAIAPQWTCPLSDLKLSEIPFVVIAQAIEKPGNLGTILRSCDAVGVDGLILCDPCTDLFNPNVVRASVGTLFTVPIATATTGETLSWLYSNQITLAATTPNTSLIYSEADYKQPIAIAFGTEQLGLTEEWLRKAAIKVKIPMNGIADSLNVATATTVMLYEVLRQRSIS